jgi:hypothetical protein
MLYPHSTVTITRTPNGWIVTTPDAHTRLYTEDEAFPLLYMLHDLAPVETARMTLEEFEARLR